MNCGTSQDVPDRKDKEQRKVKGKYDGPKIYNKYSALPYDNFTYIPSTLKKLKLGFYIHN